MKRFLLFISALFICNIAIADDITINWSVDNQPYTTTTCTVGDDVVLPPVSKRGHVFRGWQAEHFDRGTFADWASVPMISSSYKQNYHGNHTPYKNDYIVITDTSDYCLDFGDVRENAVTGVVLNTNNGTIVGNSTWKTTDFLPVLPDKQVLYSWTRAYSYSAGKGQACFYNIGKEYINCRRDSDTTAPGNYITTFITPSNAAFMRVSFINSDTKISLCYGDSVSYSGTWRFVYSGVWEVDGKNGWKPDYQISSNE